jgi:hypothetical protein
VNNVINMPFSLEEIGPVLDVSEFLMSNLDELTADFSPKVLELLGKKDKFQPPYRIAFNNAVDDLIVGLIQEKVKDHFNVTPEQLLLLTEVQFLKMIVPDLFNSENYLKE